MNFWSQGYSERIHTLGYDRFTEDQEPEIWRLIEYLGLNWKYTCLAPEQNKRSVKTTSNEQVCHKVYEGSSMHGAIMSHSQMLSLMGIKPSPNNQPDRHVMIG